MRARYFQTHDSLSTEATPNAPASCVLLRLTRDDPHPLSPPLQSVADAAKNHAPNPPLVNSQPKPKIMSTWLLYALLTVFSWGVYAVILHKGRALMPGINPPGPEAAHASLKAFLLVCFAYAAIGIITAILLKVRGSDYSFTMSGISWSFVAGFAGALGAFALVLALGAAAMPVAKGGGGFGLAAAAAVAPIVFAGAPVVNTVTSMLLHPPPGGLKAIPWQFLLGCVLAASGAFLVAKFAPSSNPAAAHKPAAAEAKPH